MTKLSFLESLLYAISTFLLAVITLFVLSLLFKLFSFVMDKIVKNDFKKIFKKKSKNQEEIEIEGPIYATVTDEKGIQKEFKLASIKKIKEND